MYTHTKPVNTRNLFDKHRVANIFWKYIKRFYSTSAFIPIVCVNVNIATVCMCVSLNTHLRPTQTRDLNLMSIWA